MSSSDSGSDGRRSLRMLLLALSPPTDVVGPPLLLDKDEDWRDALLALVQRLHDPDGRGAVDAAVRAAQAAAYGN